MHTVVARDRPFSSVVCKPAHAGALVQRHDGIGAERAKAHGGHVEQADVVGLCAIFAAHFDTKVMTL